jgi:hypothetical protein
MKRLSKYANFLLICVLCFGMLPAASSMAAPNAPGIVPNQVGNFQAARNLCDSFGRVSMPNWILQLISFASVVKCHEALNLLDKRFDTAYLESEQEGGSPGYPTIDIHIWKGVAIQDFVGGTWGDGAGAIIQRGQRPVSSPKYVGGYAWVGFKTAVSSYNVFPGYPINTQHNWNKVRLQDFREGTWGTGAIIVDLQRKTAQLVAGNHWKAYILADGSNRLRNPTSFVFSKSGWRVQNFDGGELWENGGQVKVYYYDTKKWLQFRV